MKNLSRLEKEFASPSSRYRGKTFWAWNGELEEGELRRQIRVMQRMGFGGFFMHARVGLATPYLSSEYLDLTRACIDEAKRLGLEAWLYDEDRWPSGFAGGLVTREERFRERALVCEKLSQRTYRGAARDVAVFAASWQGEKLKSYRRVKRRASGRSQSAFHHRCGNVAQGASGAGARATGPVGGAAQWPPDPVR